MTVEVDTDYEPDAVVNCGPPIPDDAVAATNPVIVVEVLSPGTRGIDTGAKLVRELGFKGTAIVVDRLPDHIED